MRRSLIVLTALLMSACNLEVNVTPEQFAKATSECESHKGLKYITHADQQDESYSCGRYCNKLTGRVQLHAAFSCVDDTKFDLSWYR
jgi:hypothetical protein